MPLTPRQERFVQEYLIDLNATQAAIRAGYSAKTADRIGPELLGKTCVAEAIQKAKDVRARRSKIDAEWVLKRLVRNINRASTAEPVRDKEGNPTGEYRYEGAVVNKALELVGKHVGMFTDRIKIEADVKTTAGPPFDPTQLTDDQLRTYIAIVEAASGGRATGEGEAG